MESEAGGLAHSGGFGKRTVAGRAGRVVVCLLTVLVIATGGADAKHRRVKPTGPRVVTKQLKPTAVQDLAGPTPAPTTSEQSLVPLAASKSHKQDDLFSELNSEGIGDVAQLSRVEALDPELFRKVVASSELQPDELDRVTKDPSLFVKTDGSLLAVESFPVGLTDAGTPLTAENTFDTQGQLPPPFQAFALHSRPRAKKTLYLDFNGLPSGSYWGTTAAMPAFDLDGNPSTFSLTEVTFIRDAWATTAEDYASFDIDITTEEPPLSRLTVDFAGDPEYGNVIGITPNRFYCSTCIGVAAINGFAGYNAAVGGTQFTPGGWVFWDSRLSAKTTGLTASHESGHLFGLQHDGTTTAPYYSGHGSWSPIMGAGTNASVTQWSKGEYTGANNTEDDIAIIGSKLGFVPDEEISPTAIEYLNNGATSQIINSAADTDTFYVRSGGRILATVAVDPNNPNLDARITLYAINGTLLNVYDPPGPATIFMDAAVPPGDYFLVISGEPYLTPQTGYSDYGSVGQYTLSVQTYFPPSAPAPPTLVDTGLNRALTLRWLPPTYYGFGTQAPIYTATICRYPTGDCRSVNTVGNETIFYDLEAGAQYVGRIAISNDIGTASALFPSSPVVVRGSPGPPITNNVVIVEQPDSFTFSWCCPQEYGYTLTDYEVEIRNLTTASSTFVIVVANETSSPFVAPVSGHQYAMRVRARSIVGPGPWSIWRMASVGRVGATVGLASVAPRAGSTPGSAGIDPNRSPASSSQ